MFYAPASCLAESGAVAAEELPHLDFGDGFFDGITSPFRVLNWLVTRGRADIWSPGIRSGGYLGGRVLGCIIIIPIVGAVGAAVERFMS